MHPTKLVWAQLWLHVGKRSMHNTLVLPPEGAAARMGTSRLSALSLALGVAYLGRCTHRVATPTIGSPRSPASRSHRPGFGLEDHRHAVMDFATQFLRRGGDDREAAHPLAAGRLPVLPHAREPMMPRSASASA